jgi:hypothetical protein
MLAAVLLLLAVPAVEDLRDELDATVHAVLATPPTRTQNPTPTKLYTLLALGTTQAALGDRDAARATFRLGFAAADEIGTESYRAGALARLARAQAAVGDAEGARASIDRALREALEIPNDLLRVNTLAAIASAQARLGDDAAVTATLDRMRAIASKAPTDRVDPLLPARDLIWATARAGRFDEAFALSVNFAFPIVLQPLAPDTDPRAVIAIRQGEVRRAEVRGLRAIAEAIAPQHGEAGAAALRRLIPLCDERGNAASHVYAEIMLAQAAVGDVAGALDTARRSASLRDLSVVLPSVAEAQRAAGDVDGARITLRRAFEALEQLPRGTVEPWRFRSLAGQQIEAGDLEAATRAIDALGPDQAVHQVPLLVQLARALRERGDADAAQAADERARALADARRAQPPREVVPTNLFLRDDNGRRIENLNDEAVQRDYGLMQLAGMDAALGDRDAARTRAESIANADLRRRALAALPAALAARGETAAALDEAARLDPPLARLEALDDIARALAARASASAAVRRALWP